MFNFRPDERWLRIAPPTEDVPGFRVKPPEAEEPPGLHLWSPPANDPPGFRVTADGSAQGARANDRVGSLTPTAILLSGRYRPDGGNPFYFLDRQSPAGGDPMPLSGSGSLSPYATTLLFPQLAEAQPLWLGLQTGNGELDGRPDAPSPGFHVKPPADDLPGFRVGAEASRHSALQNDVGGFTSFEYAPQSNAASYIGTGSTDGFRPAEDSRSPFSFLDRKSSDASSASGKPNSPYASVLPWPAAPSTLRVRNSAGSGAFSSLTYNPPWDKASLGSFPGHVSGPAVRTLPIMPGISPGTFGRQSPSATLVANPLRSSLLPVGDGGQHYVQNRPLNSVRGVRGVGLNDEGREILIPEKPDNRELDPFEKLKQRGYPKPSEDPSNGSAIVTKLRKDYSSLHPNYHRYEFKDALCDLGTQGCSVEAAYDALLRHAVPGGPAPGVPIENEKVSPASFKKIPGGHVQTFLEPGSRSIINRTMPNHNFHDGFAQRQIVVEDGKIYIRTFGEGINTTGDRALANRIMAKAAFEDSTATIRAALNPPQPPKAGQKWPR